MSTFNELIDFTRSTTGTYLDSVVYGDELVTNGSGEFEGANGTNIYTAYSEWANTYNSTFVIQNNKGRFTPSGGFPAASLTLSGFNSGKTYVITAQAQSNVSNKTIDIAVNGTVSTITSNGSQQVIRHEFVSNGSVESFQFRYDNNSGYVDFDNISVKEIIGGQVSGTPLLRTAAINEPRLEYDASGNPLGLLIEEARTNLLDYSEGFTTGWGTFNIVTTPNIIASPDGAVSGARLQEDSSGTGGPRRFPNDTAVLTANQAQTLSCFFKAGTSAYAYLTIRHSNGSVAGVEFDVTSGTVNSTAVYGYMTLNSSDITSVGSGWYRCSVTATSSASTSNGRYFFAMTDGSGLESTGYPNYALTGKNIYAWGAQVETGAFPTSYIPTSGSTVTRAADVASLPVERFAYNDTKGSVVVSARPLQVGEPSGSQALLEIGTADRSQIYLFARLSGTSQSRFLANNGSSQADLRSSDFVGGSLSKMSAGWAVNNFAMSMDGGAALVDTAGAVMTGCTIMGIGTLAIPSSNFLNGHIKQIQYYPKRLSNEELQLLTQPSASPTMNLTFDGQATSTLVEGFHD